MQKEKIDKKFVLIINGPLCSGKTTVANVLMNKYAGLFRASTDKIKWLISDYDSVKHNSVKWEMIIHAADVALQHDLSVIAEGLVPKKYYEEYAKVAMNNDALFVEVNLEASPETLSERFDDRMEDVAKKRNVVSVTTHEARLDRLAVYEVEKNPNALTLYTDQMTPDEIVHAIEEHMATQ